MRCRLIILTFAILIVPAFAGEALATTVDIRSITCSEYLAMPAAPSSKFSAWMTGWFSYESRRTFVDFDLHRTNVTNVRGWCQSNPSASVMVGLEKSIGVTAVPNATLDFNKITCGTWLGYGPVDQDFVRYFMSATTTRRQATVCWITTACRGIPVRSSRIARRINPALYQRPFRIELARLDQFPAAYERRRAPYECIRTRPLAWLLLMADSVEKVFSG
jgi:hypothetical protein